MYGSVLPLSFHPSIVRGKWVTENPEDVSAAFGEMPYFLLIVLKAHQTVLADENSHRFHVILLIIVYIQQKFPWQQ